MALGERAAKDIFALRKRGSSAAKTAKGATVLALQGQLGAGKTMFVQGFFRGLGLRKRAQSPTFIIMRRHSLRAGRSGTGASGGFFKNVFHLDAYRLKDPEQLAALEFEKILSDPHNIVLIEWAERAKKILPNDTIWLTFRHGKKEEERSIIMKQQSRSK